MEKEVKKKKSSKKKSSKKKVEKKKESKDVLYTHWKAIMRYINHRGEIFDPPSQVVLGFGTFDTDSIEKVDPKLGMIRAEITQMRGSGYIKHPYEKTKKIMGIMKIVFVYEISKQELNDLNRSKK